MAFFPGTLDTADGGSTPSAFATSVGGRIEEKLHDLLLAMTGRAPYDMSVDDTDARARRALFVAIGQAVFEELRDGASSGFTVSTSGGGAHHHKISVTVTE